MFCITTIITIINDTATTIIFAITTLHAKFIVVAVAGGGDRGQLLQPQDDPRPQTASATAVANHDGLDAADQPVAASWSFKTRFTSGMAHALARATIETRESTSECGGGGEVRMLPPGQSKSFAWAAVQGSGRAVRLADGKPVS